MGFASGETVTIVRRGAVTGQDTYGNDVYAAAGETDVPGCAVAVSSSSEDVTARDQVSSSATVWPPHGTDIRPTDQMRVRGVLYDVQGTPGDWRSPFTGIAAPLQVELSRVVG